MTSLSQMSTPAARGPSRSLSSPALKAAAASWLAVAVFGQLMFATYIIGFYGRAAAQGRFEEWNNIFPRGFVPGETFGNSMVALHLFFTVFIVVAGAMQLVPQVRRRVPALHRVTGRAYLIAAATLSMSGLIMMWGRGSVGGPGQLIGTSINGLLILAFAAMAWRHARAHAFDAHRRWALRLFLAVSGVWFFRIGLMLWIVVNQGPVGFDPKTFQGPFLTFLSFAQYLFPLAMLELYLRARRSNNASAQMAMAACLGVLAVATAAGVGAATMLMWLPRL